MAMLPETVLRRGGEVRCPACVRFKPPRGACPACSCGEVPLERFGAARMLARAGVDRFSLAERVATMDPRQAEQQELQYAAQWEQAWPLIEDVRRCQAHLLQEGFVEEAVDVMAARLPMDPAALAEEIGPPERTETLETLAAKSSAWMVQQLAALALVHQGNTSPRVMSQVRYCLHDDEKIGVEAVLALMRWRVWQWLRLTDEGWKRVRELARKALSQSELAPRAAVAWMRASRAEEPDVDVLFALRAGLGGSDPDVRFECALCLKDEAGLLASLDSPDAQRVSEARRVLSSMGSKTLFEHLARKGGTAFALDAVSRLGETVPPEALEALLSASERGPERLTEALLQLIGGRPFARWPEEARARWSAWAGAVLRELPGEEALRFLHWAAEPPVAPDAVRAFVEGTAQALERAPADVRARNLDDAYFSRFLALAGPEQEPLLNQWAREAECGPPLATALMTLTSRIQDWREPAGKAARLLMAVWEGAGREALLAPLQRAVREWSGIVGRDELIEAVWRRFQQHPDERGELLTVFAPWRQELWERQLASPDDPVARFEAWWHVDPEGLARQADLLMREAPPQELPRRVRSVLSAAADVVPTHPRTASLAVFYAACALANAFRAGADELAPEAERFLEWFPDFERRVQSTPAEEDERAPRSNFLEDLHTEVRLMRERLDRLREDEERKREQELRRLVAESRRRDMERQAQEAERAGEEARRRAEELQRAAEQAQSPVDPDTRLKSLRPRVPGKPIDDEVLFPGKALPTLVHYVRLLKGMGLGDPMRAMAVAGLDAISWAAEAGAWGQAMVGRMELGMRFGELMAAPWE